MLCPSAKKTLPLVVEEIIKLGGFLETAPSGWHRGTGGVAFRYVPQTEAFVLLFIAEMI